MTYYVMMPAGNSSYLYIKKEDTMYRLYLDLSWKEHMVLSSYSDDYFEKLFKPVTINEYLTIVKSEILIDIVHKYNDKLKQDLYNEILNNDNI